jgi:LacI family transcriptional regulator
MVSGRPSLPRAVTRADVARYAGVSTAVVSYVVNNGPRPVAPETAARVREAVELLNYRPNQNAQALRRGTTEMIGLVTSDSDNPFFTEFAAAIGSAAEGRGHALMMADSHASGDGERRLIDDLARRQVDGLIVASIWGRPDLTLSATGRSVPLVWIDAPGQVPGHASVGVDSRCGAARVVGHLLHAHGHGNVGLVVGPNRANADPRERGWQDALRAAGLPGGPVARCDWSRRGGTEGGRQLLERENRPTAIFASSDLQALGVLHSAHQLGLDVPGDVAVVGFDGTKESEYCWPALTVVAQPIQEMAAAAVGLVLSDNRSTEHHMFQPQLILRRSCGCP